MTWRTEICSFDLATETVTTILRSDRLLEAPNWHPDGYLIINGDGLLYRLDLDGTQVQIDTGDLNQLNNDHGQSPDGRWIAISDSSEDDVSAIYIIPAGGGTPRRVTPQVPSYWHGWTPNGETLLYTAKRGDTFQIYTVPAQGGEERALTSGFLHCDGPDATPNSAWIWFNGETAEGVNLWRIPIDGGKPERMTDTDSVDWFPHPSPDGQHVLYLAYPPETYGHPRDRDVELRLMPAKGGPARKLLDLYGGQGTINVPCWRPDSGAFAFARYGDQAAG
jgi:Tol biopolymer transport system component